MSFGATPLIEAADELSWLIDGAIRAAAVLLLAFVATTLLRGAAPGVRYVLWSVALIGALLMPALPLIVPAVPVPGLPQLRVVPVAPGGEPALPPTDPSSTAAAPVLGGAAETSVPGARPVAAGSSAWSWTLWAVGVWGIGVSLALIRLAIALRRMLRLTRDATPLGGASWNSVIARLTLSLRPGRSIRWLRSDEIETPMTWGLFRPVVLVPAEAESWSEERRRVVLLHELVHVQRRDWLIRVVAQIACAVHWFDPLVWIGSRRLDIERERACDDAIIEQGTRPSVYAAHLLEIARLMKLRATAAAALSMAHTAQLEGRLVSILDEQRPRASGRTTHLPTGLVALTIVLLVAAIEPSGRALAGGPAVPVGVDGLMVSWSDEDGQHRFETSGPVSFNREGTEVASMAERSSVRLESVGAGGARRLMITTLSTGQLRHDWSVGGEARGFDEVARRWMRSMISRGLDRTGRPAVSRFPAGPELSAAIAGLDAVITRIAVLEDEQGGIEEQKAPLYDAAGELDDQLHSLEQRQERVDARLGSLGRDRQNAPVAERAALDRRITEAEAEREEITEVFEDALARLDSVQQQLDPLIEQWFEREDAIDEIATGATPQFERCDRLIHEEIRSIVRQGLDATDLRSGAAAEIGRLELDDALTAILGGCCAYYIDPEERQLVLQVSSTVVRERLDVAVSGIAARLSPADRRALDDSVERVARLVSTLRFEIP